MGGFCKRPDPPRHVSRRYLNKFKGPVLHCIIIITAHTPPKCVLKRCVLELQRAVQED